MAFTDYPYYNFLSPQQRTAERARYRTDAEYEAFLKTQTAANIKTGGASLYNAPNPYGTPSQTPQGATRPLQVRMQDGSVQTFTSQPWADPKLDAALKNGGTPLDASGKPVTVTTANGGYLFNGQPINQFVGAGLFAGQQEALNALNGGTGQPFQYDVRDLGPNTTGTPEPPPNPNATLPQANNQQAQFPLQVRMPNGSVQSFTGQPWADPKLDAALKAGGIPLDQSGMDVKVTPNIYGGYLFNGQPINQFLGTGAFPSQTEGLQAYNASQQGQGSLLVKMADGSYKSFTGNVWEQPELDTALKAGGIPLDPISGESLQVIGDVNGGYLLKRQGDPYGLPINVIAGQGWQPNQQEALQAYYTNGPGATGQPGTSGQPGANGQPAFQGGPTPAPGATSTGSNTGARYPVAGLYSDQPELQSPLLAGFPHDFVAPTAQDLQQDPSFQFRMAQGLKAIERSGSAKGMTLSGPQLKSLNNFASDYASQEYGNVYGRQMGEYQQAYNIFANNQANRFNRLSSIAGLGQTATNQLNSAGQNFAGNASNTLLNAGQNQANNLVDQGNIRSSQYIGQSNNINSAIGMGLQPLNNFLSLSAMYNLRR